MAKSYKVLTAPGSFTALVAKKNLLVNSCAVNMFLTDAETDTALSALPNEAKTAILNAQHRLKPGESKALAAGTYNVSFDYTNKPMAVLVIES